MKFKKYFYFAVIIIFLGISVVFLVKNSREVKLVENSVINKIQYVEIGGQKVKVELARTSEEQEQGLSGRKSLGDDEGMLFIFEKPSKYSFWMPKMNFPIDIIWLDENLHIVFIKKNATPESYPGVFTPTSDSLYVLEVESDFSQKNNLKVGDLVQFLP